MDKYLPHSDLAQATEAQIDAVKAAAQYRAGYLRWLADQIERCSDQTLRRSVADQLRQLSEGA